MNAFSFSAHPFCSFCFVFSSFFPSHTRVAARRVLYNSFPGLRTGFLARLGYGSSPLCVPSSHAICPLFVPLGFRALNPVFSARIFKPLAILPQSFCVVGRESLTAGPSLFLLSHLRRQASIMSMLARPSSATQTISSQQTLFPGFLSFGKISLFCCVLI